MNQHAFRPYQKRKIAFAELLTFGDWKVKVYTITPHPEFRSSQVLKSITSALGRLLAHADNHHHMAFLIVHEGSDGIWSLLNWWTEREMLKTFTYFTSFANPDSFDPKPENGSMACTWELPVINHERNAWVKHILKNHQNPGFDQYTMDVIEGPL